LQKTILSNPEFLRNKVLKGLAIVLGVFALLLSFFNVYLQNYFLAIIEVFLSITCWLVYRKVQQDSITLIQAMVLPYFFILIETFARESFEKPKLF